MGDEFRQQAYNRIPSLTAMFGSLTIGFGFYIFSDLPPAFSIAAPSFAAVIIYSELMAEQSRLRSPSP